MAKWEKRFGNVPSWGIRFSDHSFIIPFFAVTITHLAILPFRDLRPIVPASVDQWGFLWYL
jgi:hypothetical protein